MTHYDTIYAGKTLVCLSPFVVWRLSWWLESVIE